MKYEEYVERFKDVKFEYDFKSLNSLPVYVSKHTDSHRTIFGETAVKSNLIGKYSETFLGSKVYDDPE